MTLEPVTLNERASMTMLRHFNLCPRSGYLYAKYRQAGFQSAPMQRGRAFHEVVERATRLLMDQNEPTIPGEVVKVIVDEVLADLHVPWEEHDLIREMAYRWAAEFAVDPNTILANETLFEIDVDGFKVRCRIDLAYAVDARKVRVEDYKTSRASESYEEVARKRADGQWSAKNFQLVLYALALVYGVPVRVEQCDLCEGGGDVVTNLSLGAAGSTVNVIECPQCGGRGTVETPDPFPVAARAEEFELEFVYPGIPRNDDGRMVRVPLTLSRPELEAYTGSLAGLVARVRRAEAEGDWPAVASHQACGICPAKAECPLPAALRDHVPITSMDEASAAAEAFYVQKGLQRSFQTELRNFAKEHGGIPFGDGMVWDFKTTFDVNGKKRTEFSPRALSAEEIEQRSTPHVGHGEDRQADREAGREEEAGSRWGDAPPF